MKGVVDQSSYSSCVAIAGRTNNEASITELPVMVITEVASPNSVQLVDRPQQLKTPPSKKRRTRKMNETAANIQLHPAMEEKPLDLTKCSPYVSDSRRVALTIELTEEEKNSELVRIDITTGVGVAGRLSVPPMFQETVATLQKGLDDLGIGLEKEEDKRTARRKSPECVKVILWLGPTADSLESIESSLDGCDIHTLLTDEAYLSDSPLDYYRCLLIREEMKRAQIFHKEHWRRSWIHSTSFMSMLYIRDKKAKEWGFNYDFVASTERRYLGNGAASRYKVHSFYRRRQTNYVLLSFKETTFLNWTG